MKKLLILVLAIGCTSCWYTRVDEPEYLQSAYEPVILSRTDFENSTELMASQPNIKAGKIYVKDAYLIINEPNKGFHIYNNSDPKAPLKIGFLKLLGSSDISIRGNMLYANNGVDLIAVKIDLDANKIDVTKRVKNVFPEKISPDGFFNYTSGDEVVVDWVLKTK